MRRELFVILLLAFALRVHDLGVQDMWGDEAFSVSLAESSFSEILRPGSSTHPPLFHAALGLWLRITGVQVFALRFGVLMLSMLALPLIYRLARRLADERAALVAAFLAAISPLHIYYAQELRMYALFMLLTLGSMLMFARLTERPGRGRWVGYLAVTLAAMFSHYNIFWVIGAQNLVALLSTPWRGRRTRWLGGQAVLALIYLPWAIYDIPLLLRDNASGAEYSITLSRLPTLIGAVLQSWVVGITVEDGAFITLIVGGGLLLALFGLYRRADWQAMLLALWMGVTLAMVFLFDPFFPFFHERFAIAGASALLIAAAYGLTQLSNRRALVGLGLAPLIAGSVFANVNWFTDPAYIKSDYGQVMREIAADSAPDDLLLLSNPAQGALAHYYTPATLPQETLDVATVNSPQTADYLQQVTTEAGRVWLVEFGDPIGFDSMRLVPGWLAENGFRQRFFSFGSGTVSLYVLDSSEAVFEPVEAQFGDAIRLTGYSLQPERIAAGDTLRLTLRWEALAAAGASYTVANQVLNAEGRLVAQTDALPRGGALPTDQWQPGERINDRYAIALPDDLPPGEYTLAVGLYPWPDLTRISVESEALIPGIEDVARLVTFRVE